MKNIDERDSTYLFAIITIFAVATIAVVCYILLGSTIAVYTALGCYTLGFALICLSSIRKLFTISNYNERIEKYEKQIEFKDETREKFLTTKDNISKILKSTKRKEIIRTIFSGILTIFSVVVLVLF